MNMFKQGMHLLVVLIAVGAFHLAWADDDVEARFGALRTLVARLLPNEPAAVRDRIEKARWHITDCPAGTPEPEFGDGRVAIGVKDIDFLYATPGATLDDNVDYCFYIVKPLHRALTADEGRDFSAALMMPDIPQFLGGQPTPEERAAAAKIGEERFKEVRALLAAGKGRPFDPEDKHRYVPPIGSLEKLKDCSGVSNAELDRRADDHGTQVDNLTIYNGSFYWKDIDPSGQRCIYMLAPFKRGLSIAEARDFLIATQLDLGFSEQLQQEFDEQSAQDAAAKAENDAAAKTQKKTSPKSGDAVTGIAPLTNSAYPYNTIAVLNLPGSGPGITSSAVQVGKYVYMTAGHNVLGSDNKVIRGFVIKPAFHLPSQTNPIHVDVTIEPGYAYGPNQIRGHDLAYLRAAAPHSNPDLYAKPITIISSRDIGGGISACAATNHANDPFWDGQYPNSSWYNPTGGSDCSPNGAARFIVHYPNSVNGGSNNNVTDPHPYLSTGVGLFGSSSGNTHYELFHSTADGKYVIGMRGAYISPGSSGGALFGTPAGGSLADSRLLGIVTVAQGTDGYATGDFDYNSSIMWTPDNLAWEPTGLINITSPTEGGSYDSSSVPNLVATAGSQTSQLQWKSDIDGVLGTGGNVSVAGRLSPGAQTITASIGATAADAGKAVDATVLKTLHITVTGSLPAPTFSISPSTVLVPATETTGPFTYAWNAPGYGSLDVQSSINNGAWAPVPALNIPASGSSGDQIAIGTTYKYRFFPHGNTTTVLGTLMVTGAAAPAPVFAANPVHIVTNGPSGNTTLTWNAPGYVAGIDWCASINAAAYQCGSLTTPSSGSSVVSVPVGTTYAWRFYPHGSPSQGGGYHLLGQLTVDAVGSGATTFNADPTHVIVPASGTAGNTVVTWNAPAYSGLDWCGKTNSGPWTAGLSTAGSGKIVVSVPLGTTYGYRIYPPGGSTGCGTANDLGEVSVYATH